MRRESNEILLSFTLYLIQPFNGLTFALFLLLLIPELLPILASKSGKSRERLDYSCTEMRVPLLSYNVC